MSIEVTSLPIALVRPRSLTQVRLGMSNRLWLRALQLGLRTRGRAFVAVATLSPLGFDLSCQHFLQSSVLPRLRYLADFLAAAVFDWHLGFVHYHIRLADIHLRATAGHAYALAFA